jgi:hypothetical protein
MNTDMRIEQSGVIRDVEVMTSKVALTTTEGRHLLLSIQNIEHIFIKKGTDLDEDENILCTFGVLYIVMKNSNKQSLFFTDNLQMVLELVNSVNHWKFTNA